MIDLSDLESLVAVIDAGGFVRAATRLGVSKSLVSRRIFRLEQEMGAPLLLRTPRGLAETAAGRELAVRARKILQEVANARDAVAAQSGAIAGRMRLAVPLSFGLRYLQPLFHELHAAHPKLVLDVCYSDSHVDIVNGQFDAAIRIGRIPDSGLVSRRIARIELVAVASPVYLQARGTPIAPQDLVDHECLVYTGSQQRQTWRFSEAGHEQTILPEGRFLADNGEGLLRAAEAGLGIAALPDFVVKRGIAERRLLQVLPAFTMQEGEIFLASPAGAGDSARVKALLALLLERFGAGQTNLDDGTAGGAASAARPASIGLGEPPST